MLIFYHVKTIHFTAGCRGFRFNSLPAFFSLPFLSVPFHFVSLLLRFALKGPKHEIFESGFFTQIRGLWLGELGTGEKN